MIFRQLLCILGLAFVAQPVAAQFTISGTVTRVNATPVFNVNILLFDNLGNPIGIPQTATDSFGVYSITSIPPGTYGVGFEPKTSDKLVATIHTPVTVVAANVTLNKTLQPGFYYSGDVRDTLGVGLPDIDLNVYVQSTGAKLLTPGDNTNALGHYNIVLPAGTFTVRWREPNGALLVPVEMQNVVITADAQQNITMLPALKVDGKILDSLGVPVANVDLDFINQSTGLVQFTPGDNTDANGEYEIFMPVDTFVLQVKPDASTGLLAQEYQNVVMRVDTTIDITLLQGKVLSGTVRDEFNVPAPGVDLDIHIAGTGTKLVTPSDNTNASGFYQVVVPSGSYDVTFTAPSALRLVGETATNVSVTSNTTLNANLESGILLSGFVRNPALIPVVDVDIDALTVPGGVSIPLSGDKTTITGTFGIVVEPGTYQIDFEPLKSRRLAAKRLSSLVLSADTSVTIVLDTGMLVTGTVLSSGGSPLSNLDIDARTSPGGVEVPTLDDKTLVNGTYSILLAAGTFNLIYGPNPPTVTDSVVRFSVPITKDTVINVSFGSAANVPPVLSTIGTKTVNAGSLLQFNVSATDQNGNQLTLTTSTLPGTAQFQDNGNATGTFTWNTTLPQVGTYQMTFRVSDGLALDSEAVTINVLDPSTCCNVSVGNVDCDGLDMTDISDLTTIIDHLFINNNPLCCPAEANIDVDVLENVDISDLTTLIDHLFINNNPLGSCL